MKSIFVTILLLLTATIIVAQPIESDKFTRDQAREYIMGIDKNSEYTMARVQGFSKEHYDIKFHYYSTTPDEYPLSPGRYHIKLDEANYTKSKGLHALSIPIETETKYMATIIDKHGDSYDAPTSQRLLIYKRIGETRVIYNRYIVTFIPSHKQLESESDSDYADFIHPSNIGGYDGIVIFSNPDNGKIEAAGGGKRATFSMYGTLDEMQESVLKGVEIKRLESSN